MTIILLLTVIAIQVITFHKLNKKIMGAEQTVTEMIEQVIAIVSEAFNTQVGDLTAEEAEAKKADFIQRINDVINPPIEG